MSIELQNFGHLLLASVYDKHYRKVAELSVSRSSDRMKVRVYEGRGSQIQTIEKPDGRFSKEVTEYLQQERPVITLEMDEKIRQEMLAYAKQFEPKPWYKRLF